MIISPPFLPAVTAGQTDDAWIEAAMPAPSSQPADTGAPEGSFPLSHYLMWHNGVHLQAPMGNGSSLPARAIADGTVVFVKAPTPPNATITDAQNYNPFDRPGAQTAAWTDNGCVIIEHRTSIGAEGATETEVVFYSVTMHLSALGKITPAGQTTRRDLAPGDPIWRKDEVGTPGSIYGHTGQIHFEICCDAANLQALIGRAPNWVEPVVAPATLPAPTADGRIDSIFGSLYLYLPASTPTDAGTAQPTSNLRGAAAAGATTLGTPVWVKMTYATGDCSFESFDERGAVIGAARTDADAEYGLFAEATARHTALPAANQALSSPSGWYELLRFGRNIGRGAAATDKDPLPANAAHWRRIIGANGATVWADLNAEGSFKFSDADFLPVMGWNCIDDDTNPTDQRCDSVNLKNLIRDPDPANTERMETSELTQRLGDEAVKLRLRRTFCKFPSEWDKSSIAARYAFVQELEPFKADPEAWPRLEAHLNAVSFDGLPAGYPAAEWRFHPREFFGQMRKCGWLSAEELSLIIPRFPYYDKVGTTHRAHTAGPAAIYQVARQAVRTRLVNYFSPLNRTMRKYGIQSRVRQGHFLSQTILETDRWRTVREYGQGAANAAIPMAQYYAAFFGRGIMQLTWLGNYRDYLDYRTSGALANHVGAYSDRRITQQSTHWTGAPGGSSAQVRWAPKFDPEVIASNAENACDSGGFYWASKAIGQGAHDLNTTCDRGVAPDVVGRVSVLVNGGGNGYMERQAYAQYLFRYLFDEVIAASTLDVVTPRGRISVNFEKPQ